MALLLDAVTNKIGSFLGTNTSQPGPKSGGFSIQEFSSKINEVDGLLPTNLFLVTIFAPNLDGRTLSFFTMNTQLPGIEIAYDENIRLGIGPVERYPHAAVFDSLNLTFLGDGRGYIMNALHVWMNNIVEYQMPTSSGPGENYYKVQYKTSYMADMEIVVYNTTSDKVLVYKFKEVYPYSLAPVEMSWAKQNDIMLIGARFFYTNWSSYIMDPVEGETTGLTFLQKLQKAGTIVSTLASLKKPQSIGDAINLVNNANIVGSNLGGFF